MQSINPRSKQDSLETDLDRATFPVFNRIALPILATLSAGLGAGCVSSQDHARPLDSRIESVGTQNDDEITAKTEPTDKQSVPSFEYAYPGLTSGLRQADAWFSLLLGAEQANHGGLEKLNPRILMAVDNKFSEIRREMAVELRLSRDPSMAESTRQNLELVQAAILKLSNLDDSNKIGSIDRNLLEVVLTGHESLHQIFDIEKIGNSTAKSQCGNVTGITRNDAETQSYFETLFGLARQNQSSLARVSERGEQGGGQLQPSRAEPEEIAADSDSSKAKSEQVARRNSGSAVTWDPFISKQQAPVSVVEEASIWVGLIGGAYAIAKVAAPFFGFIIP